MKAVPIGSLTEKVDTWNPAASGQIDEFSYIDLGSVDQATKTIARTQRVRADQAPSRARQLVRSGDVLVATVRPNLNGVALVPDELDGATASTGFCVLRPGRDLDASYLFHWVRSPQFVADMTRKATGQSYPAVSDRIVKESTIPAPPIATQRLIAGALDQADGLRTKRRQAMELVVDLSQSIFLEMFGDPLSNPKRWPMKKIGDLVESASYGTSAKAALEGTIPVLRMNNITVGGDVDLRDLKYMDDGEVGDRYRVRRGDILFNRTNSADLVGKTAIYRGTEPLAYAGYLVRVRTNELADPEYLAAFLNTAYAKRVLRGMCKSIVGMANINARELRSIPIAQPPVDLQREFAQRLASVESLKAIHANHLACLDELFACVQYRAFRGELWADSTAA